MSVKLEKNDVFVELDRLMKNDRLVFSMMIRLSNFQKNSSAHTSYLSILVHRRIIEVYKKYTKTLSELATK